jgi:hypothetical protein
LRYAAQRQRYHGRLHPGDLVLEGHEARVLGIGLGDRPEHPGWNVADPYLFEPLVYTAPEAMPSRDFPESNAGRAAVDLYALGAILFHKLTGHPPFHGGDEEALRAEREGLAPRPVSWPAGAARTLPAGAMALVDQLMATEPAQRGTWDDAEARLGQLFDEIQGKVRKRFPKAAPPVVLPPAEANQAPPGQPEGAPAPAPLAQGTWQPSAPEAPTPAYAPPPGYSPYPYPPESRRGDRVALLMMGAALLILGLALGLLAHAFNRSEPTAPQPAAAPTPVTPPAQLPPGESDQDVRRAAEAARALERWKKLREEGVAELDRGSWKYLAAIVESAPQSDAAYEARLLMGKIEALTEKPGAVGAPASAAAPPPTASMPEDKRWTERLRHLQEAAAAGRYGQALDLLTNLPPELQHGPAAQQAQQQLAQYKEKARLHFYETAAKADALLKASDFAGAKALYAELNARIGMPEWETQALARIQEIDRQEERVRKTEAARQAQVRQTQEWAAAGAAVRKLVPKLYRFQYDECLRDLDDLARIAQTPEVKQFVQDYADWIRDEQWLFQRCQDRYAEQAKRERKYPLQVFDNDGKVVGDIQGFTREGLTIIPSPQAGKREPYTREWKTIPPKQPFVMLSLLYDRANGREHLALAAHTFHRALKLYQEAAGKGDGEPKADGATLKAGAEDFEKEQEKSLQSAVQNDAFLREKVGRIRELSEKIKTLALE